MNSQYVGPSGGGSSSTGLRLGDGQPQAGSSSSAAGPNRTQGQLGGSDDSSSAAAQKRRDQEEKSRRAYRACTNCRTRKAKCDLGDIDNPKDPPCARCKREKRDCTFLPSRRGGNLAAKAKAKQEALEEENDALSFEPGTFSSGGKRRTSFASGTTDGLASKKPKNGDGGFSAAAAGGQDDHARPRSTSNVSAWSSTELMHNEQLDWSSGLSLPGVPLSPLVGSSTLPAMQTSPLSIGSHLLAPNFNTGATTSSAQPLPGSHPPPTHRSPYQSLTAPQISPTSAAMLPPPEHTSPIFTHRPSYLNDSLLDSTTPSFPRKLEPPPFPSSLGSATATSTLPAPPKPALARRTTATQSTSRPENFIVAGMANEADALSLLALTATTEKHKASGKSPGTASEPADTPDGRQSERSARSESSAQRKAAVCASALGEGTTGVSQAHVSEFEEHHSDNLEDDDDDDRAQTPPPLAECDLIRKGILTKELLVKYVDQFFRRHHQIFPMIPVSRMPKTELDLQLFAHEEKHLLTTMVIIASRHDAEHPSVHEKAWEVMSGYISTCVVNGRETCVGFVESMLLLSENLPRQEDKDDLVARTTGDTSTWDDSTQSWFLVGHAVRTGYLLGLDQQTLYVDPKAPTTPELDRERLAWTYCYLFDRHISLRIGRAFWSRGPGLCFKANDAHANFPSLRPIPGQQDDLASVVQALVELTQQMTTAHDILYPSKERTSSLMKAGEYFKALSEFERSVSGFERTWRRRTDTWTFPCSDVIWATYHYLRLYIYAFSFQAHVQRAAEQGQSSHGKFGGLFPRGVTQSPDAKFILESIDAARQLLELCTERLHPGGALAFLPARVYLWLTFSSVFLLKAIYSGAISQGDTRHVVELIQKVIFCLANASPDRQHLGLRHALLLRTVMKTLRIAFDTAEWVSHTGTATPLFPERWHIPPSRPASPERSSASAAFPLAPGSTSTFPASPWPGGLSQHAQHLPPAGFGTPSVLPDHGVHSAPQHHLTGGGGDAHPGQRQHGQDARAQDWMMTDFGDLLEGVGGGLMGSMAGGGSGSGANGGAANGLSELAFLDMELGSSWWTNVLPPEGNQGRR